MSTAELKSNLYKLIESINDSKTLSVVYAFISSGFKTKGSLNDTVLTHFSAESSLAKDWNKIEEDEAWKNL